MTRGVWEKSVHAGRLIEVETVSKLRERKQECVHSFALLATLEAFLVILLEFA